MKSCRTTWWRHTNSSTRSKTSACCSQSSNTEYDSWRHLFSRKYFAYLFNMLLFSAEEKFVESNGVCVHEVPAENSGWEHWSRVLCDVGIDCNNLFRCCRLASRCSVPRQRSAARHRRHAGAPPRHLPGRHVRRVDVARRHRHPRLPQARHLLLQPADARVEHALHPARGGSQGQLSSASLRHHWRHERRHQHAWSKFLKPPKNNWNFAVVNERIVIS